jgi:hypothetical protein
MSVWKLMYGDQPEAAILAMYQWTVRLAITEAL